MRFRDTSMMGAAAVAAIVLAGCGSSAEEAVGQLTDALSEGGEAEEAPAEPVESDEDVVQEAEAAEGDDVQEDAAADEVTVDGRAIDASVHHNGLEYTVSELTVVDLDADSDTRVQGLELTFAASVFNPSSDTAQPSPAVSLRWDEPDTGNVVDVSGRAEFRQVPGDSSSSGEILVQLAPADLEVYDDASARLILGQSGRSPAEVAVGAEAESVDRFPVQQPLTGEAFDVSGVQVEITAAEVRWDYTGSEHVEDGIALLELTYTMDNQSDSQSCSTRGEGAFALTLPNGDGIVDEGVTERCVSGGETETDVRTGFIIDADYAGDYTLRHERGDEQDEVTFTLVEDEGSSVDERDTR